MKNFQYYIKTKNLILKIVLNENQSIDEFVRNKLNKADEFERNSREEIHRVLRNNEENMFQFAISASDDFYKSVVPKGYCVLFSLLACYQQLFLTVQDHGENKVSKPRNRNCSKQISYSISSRDNLNVEPRVCVYDINNDEDRIALLQFIDLILERNNTKGSLFLETVSRLQKLKSFIGSKQVNILKWINYWLPSDQFSAIMDLCGVGSNFALFRNAHIADFSHLSDKKKRKEAEDSYNKDKGFMEKSSEDRYVWLFVDQTHFLNFSDISNRIKYTTVVHYLDHAWLQPCVSVEELDAAFEELVTLIYDAYSEPGAYKSSIVEKFPNETMERGIIAPTLGPTIYLDAEASVMKDSTTDLKKPSTVKETVSSNPRLSMESLTEPKKIFIDAATSIDPELFSKESWEEGGKTFNDAATSMHSDMHSEDIPFQNKKRKREPVVYSIPAHVLQEVKEKGESDHVCMNVTAHCRRACSICKRYLSSYICASCLHYKDVVKYLCHTRQMEFENKTLNKTIRVLVPWEECRDKHKA